MKQPKGGGSAAMDNLGGLNKETARSVEVAEKAIETCEKLAANTAALDGVAKAIEESTKNLKGKNDSLAARLGKVVAAFVILLAGIAVGALSLGTSGLNYGQAVAAATQAIDTNERVDTIRTQVASIDRKADRLLLAQERPVVIIRPAPAAVKQPACPDKWEACDAAGLLQVAKTLCGDTLEGYTARDMEKFGYTKMTREEFNSRFSTKEGCVVATAPPSVEPPLTREARVRAPVGHRTNRGGDLTEEELGLIRRRMLQRFGEPAPGTVNYGVMETKGAPAPGCVRTKREDDRRSTGMQMARWHCPKGTVRRLGL